MARKDVRMAVAACGRWCARLFRAGAPLSLCATDAYIDAAVAFPGHPGHSHTRRRNPQEGISRGAKKTNQTRQTYPVVSSSVHFVYPRKLPPLVSGRRTATLSSFFPFSPRDAAVSMRVPVCLPFRATHTKAEEAHRHQQVHIPTHSRRGSQQSTRASSWNAALQHESETLLGHQRDPSTYVLHRGSILLHACPSSSENSQR